MLKSEKSFLLSKIFLAILYWVENEISFAPSLNLEENQKSVEKFHYDIVEAFAQVIFDDYSEETIDNLINNFKTSPVLSKSEITIYSEKIIIRNLVELNYDN